MASEDDLLVNTLRFLAVDMVEEAKSGHPGLPLGAAPMAYVLWDRYLKHNPADPAWPDRDRFVLSAGHGSALLYALLHVTGYDLPLDELRRFRRYGSRTPGHPEHGLTPGVEATTGPLGQGFATAVGMALAQRYLASRFNRPGYKIVDHTTFVLCSDGDLMEGLASEAASFAGTLGVSPLVVLYDDNHVSLEGPTSLAFTEDVGARFRAYGWQVDAVEDGNSIEALDAAIRRAVTHPGAPWLLRVRTHLGYGSPRQDTKEAHGEPLGPEGTRETKRKLGWPLEPAFLVPEEAKAHFRRALGRGRAKEEEWKARFEEYRRAEPELAREFERLLAGTAPSSWSPELPSFSPPEPVATRDASAKVQDAVAEQWPALLGGSADLAPSTKTLVPGLGDFSFSEATGRNLHFGVRENAMVAMLNGLALHGGIRPYGSTFLIFSDYARPSIRLAALMHLPILLVFTHDSIALGEDGPTHQPVEQLATLRAIPGFTVLRPADANETTEAWRVALGRSGPVALVLTRQKLPVLDLSARPVRDGVRRGAYVLAEAPDGARPAVVLLATGSEVHLALAARERLAGQGIASRVVSMPSRELFEEQDAPYRQATLPPGVPTVVVEAASPLGWDRYAGTNGRILGLNRFGASAPGPVVYEHLGFSVDHLVALALEAARGTPPGTG